MMLKCEKTETGKGRVGDGVKKPRILPVSLSPFLPVFLMLIALTFMTGCRDDMQNQPKMKPYRSTKFFPDGLSARQPIPGTVARGFLRDDTEFFTGKKAGTQSTQAQQTSQDQQAPAQDNSFPDDIDYFPIPITEDIVKRGRDRYDIFCSACHGLTGNGDGMIVRRGFRRAASFNDDRLRQAPVGHFFDAITNGWGAMPSYASQVAVQDRWAIVAYIRALQEAQKNLTGQSASPAPAASPTPVPGGHE